MHCGVTSLQLTLTPCFAQTSKQLAGRAARREAHLPLSALTEPNQVLWAQEVPRKCSCLSGHLWSLRRWDQSTTSPSQEASVLPSPPRSTKDFEPDSWVCVCSPLPTASLALWQGSGNGFRVRVFNRRWVKKIDWANLRIKKKKHQKVEHYALGIFPSWIHWLHAGEELMFMFPLHSWESWGWTESRIDRR